MLIAAWVNWCPCKTRLGQVVSLVYNALGQQIALVNPLGNRLSFTYNANGIVQSVQDPLGAITTYLSDQVNRLTTCYRSIGRHIYLRV